MDNKTQNRIPGLSIYLGPEPERTRRLEALRRLAEHLHVSMSEMIRMLADGELALIVTPMTIKTPQPQTSVETR